MRSRYTNLGRRQMLLAAPLLLAACAARREDKPAPAPREARRPPSLASRWLDVALEATAQEVTRRGPRPTVLSRTLALPLTAMFDAWAAYDDHAVGTRGAELRRPAGEHTEERKRAAISYAMCDALCESYPESAPWIRGELRRFGYDPANASRDPTTPEGIGHLVAAEIMAARRDDGANMLGGYADTTGYTPVNPAERIIDPDRWQPIRFADGRGGTITPGFLTPHWGNVRPFALSRGDALRPPPPPKMGSKELFEQAKEVLDLNASLECSDKAIVELMRDGPRSTGQAGHWLSLAQQVSRRDGNDLDTDVKMYFLVANVAFDAFIAAWDSKRAYDSSRPWTLIHHYWAGQQIRGWGGPDQGAVIMRGEEWRPYSPSTFITPPFPGYVSGHSCVSGACAEALRLFTGSDAFGFIETRACGVLTESVGHTHTIKLPTFTGTADLAGRSRILGGYHIAADNVEGLRLGRAVVRETWPTYRRHLG